MEIEIDAPIEEVYQKAIDLDSIPQWMVGVTGIKRDQGVERIGTRHVCMTPMFEMDVELDYAEFKGDSAIIVNKFTVMEFGLSGTGTEFLKKIDENKTLLTDTSMWQVPDEMRKDMIESSKVSLGFFKALCEGKEFKKEIV